MNYPASELVLDAKGRVYHLGLSPENIAETVILVGDQDRVALVSAFFDSIFHQSKHREFVCHTGTYKGKKLSVLSTGIGTDNIDIAVNELDALVNIDLIEKTNKPNHTTLNLIRIGTCGILQANIPLHSYLLSTHAIGIDNVAHFYPISFSTEEVAIANAFKNSEALPNEIIPYCAKADDVLLNTFQHPNIRKGFTLTSSGFYAPQGRSLRLGLSNENIHQAIADFEFNDTKIVNFEMESSALFALGKGLGHRCATICLGIANRPKMEFSKGYEKEMNALIQFVLDSL